MVMIHLLGEFLLTQDRQPVTTLSADRPQALLAYLLLHRRAPQARRHVAFVLWPDSSEKQAQSNLRNLLHTLRNALPGAEQFLASDNLSLQWRADAPYTLDVAQFEDALSAAAAAPDDAAARQWLSTAVDAYGGDLLPGNYDDWIVPIREELRGRYQEALRRLVQSLEAAGDYQTALRYGGRLLVHDPLDEHAYVQLMRLHALRGDRAGVRRLYEQCVATLARELEVEPSEATHAAYRQLRRMEAGPAPSPVPAPPVSVGAQSGQPAPVAAQQSRPRLPLAATPFVGREAELQQVAALLADPACRLLTLVGPGGVGKTRLALQAAGAATTFAEGVVFVSLVAVRDVEQGLTLLAHELNLTLSGAFPLPEQLGRWLHDKALLLVLDNLEHLLSGAELLSALLAHAPQVKVLATSRERLNLQEEWVLQVEGLPAQVTPRTGPAADDGAAPAESAAITLFLQRARRIRSDFTPTPADLPAIERICRLVDGLPLGIELAAAWVHLLSCAEIATEIERNLDFLATPARNVPERHRTMRAVFDHSWALLSPLEQQALRRLSVFRGGFSRAMAEQVSEATLPLLASLVDKSLLHRNRAEAPTKEGRFELHERVRQYAYRKLHETGEAEQMRDRQLQALLALATAAERNLFGVTQPAALAELHTEQGNLYAALAWGLQQSEAVTAASTTRQLAGMQLAGALARFWYLSSYLQEGCTFLETALALAQQWSSIGADSTTLQPVRAKLLFGAGEILNAMDRRERGIALLQESLALYRALDDDRHLVLTLQKLGEVTLYAWPHPVVAELLAESLARARRLAEPWFIARSLALLATLALNQSDYPRATALATESLAIFRRLEPGGSVIVLLNLLGQLALFQGDVTAAVAHLEEALALIRQRPLAGNESLAWTLRNLGRAMQLAGNLDQAADCYRQSLQLRRALGQTVGAAWAMEGLADVAVVQGAWVRGVRLWAAAAAIRTAMDAPMSSTDRTDAEASLACLHTALPDDAFTAAWQAGAALTADAAFEEALA
ncbi:MAG: tetratricopeptide repeat protein [Caldilineaceae bacterium]